MRPACGMVALVLASASQIALTAELLPRVFFQPADRAAIAAQRRLATESTGAAGMPAAAAVPALSPALEVAPVVASSASLRLEGISIARDGQAFAWFNGRRYNSGSLLGASRLQVTREGVRLNGADGRIRMLRVGETLGHAP